MPHSSFNVLESWSAEFMSRADRVRGLIGSAHWLTDGKQKEHILSDFLERHLPQGLSVTTGFICPPSTEPNPSREIDILLADYGLSPPWFSEGGVAIVPPQAVVAQVQVKTTLGAQELADVLESTARTYSITTPYVAAQRIWSGGFFFNAGDFELPEAAARLVRRCFENAAKDAPPGMALSPHFFPKCIVVLGHYVILVTVDTDHQQSKTATVRIFSDKKFAPAVFLASLSSHILHLNKRDPNTHLETLLQRVSPHAVEKFDVSCTTNNC